MTAGQELIKKLFLYQILTCLQKVPGDEES